MSEVSYVVVGPGVAGVRAAESLRKDGVDGRVILIGDEPDQPYERPELSKGYLAGHKQLDELKIRGDGWYAEQGVELMLGRAVRSLDRVSRTIVLDDGEHVGYDRLLLAPGSAPKRLDLPGAGVEGVHYLRRLGDSGAIRAAIGAAASGGGPIVVIGAGWIGLEVAAVARQAGADVTVLESGPAPLARVIGAEAGERFAQLHRAHGTRVRSGVRIARITGSSSVTGVELDDGSVVPAAAVIVGIGVLPNTALAASSGLPVEDGILVDASLRTPDPRIWAAGDAANCENTWVGARLRVDHFATAEEQGTFAGHGMAGSHETWGVAPYFWSDQYDTGLEYRGWADPATSHLVMRGDDGSQQWAAFWLDADGRIQAGLHVNCWDDAGALRELVSDRRLVVPRRLADPAIPLAEVSSD
jgi:3-phenylpropionate/trans-cinnamate dioxygenase ferredoxin reductase component